MARASSKIKPIYLDYLATTPLDPRVLAAMQPYFTEHFGNAASTTHAYGWRAKAAVDLARERVASLIGARPEEIHFTSGATESNNLALFGALAAQPQRSLITAATEHRAVLDPSEYLAKRATAHFLGVDARGQIDLDELEARLKRGPAMLALMAANNETGVLSPLREISALARKYGALLHSDAAQALGKIHFSVDGLDLAALSAHKVYGPKGVGALYVRRGVQIEPMFHGGGHEGGLRSGTLNVPGIVGFGAACEILLREGVAEAESLRSLRDRLWEHLSSNLPEIERNGDDLERTLPQVLNLSFLGVSSAKLMMELPELALSSGSACSSATPRPSHVLAAMGLSKERIESAIRISLGRMTTEEEMERAGEMLVDRVKDLRICEAPTQPKL